jgi:beta-glucosidase
MAFPENFWWGTASSSTPVEGAAPASTWSAWERAGRAPISGEGNGFTTNFHRDWAMLAEHGLRQHRLTLEWARIEPRPGQRDGAAVEHYREVLRAAGASGISVWATLHHTTLPGWFADDEHGFGDEHARTYFWARHVDTMGELFGDLVKGWVPVHDPFGFARRGWLTGTRPPGRRDPEQFLDTLRAAHRANLDAWKLLRSGESPVACDFGVTPAFPAVRSREPDEREAASVAARRFDDLAVGCWIGALRDGIFALPDRAPEELPDFAGAFDLVGISLDHAVSVYADGSLGPYPADARTDASGHVPWPEGAALSIRRVHDALPDRPLVVTAATVATPSGDRRQDEWRAEVLQGLLREVERAVDDGIDMRGFFHDTAVDGYEWEQGFTVERGLFDRDRRPKQSVWVLAGAAGVTRPAFEPPA